MDRLQQLLRNSFIRLEGLLYQIFGFIRKIFGFFYQRLLVLLQALGFSTSSYYVEGDRQNNIESAEDRQITEVKSEKIEPSFTPNRRPDPQMEYYRKLAGQVNPTKK
ncbi:threonine dehydratase [Chroococcidiopsis sp. CCALA 051]|uniref:threonine dehydratase n=1 Tax=Chroococcidiopsis sp. CCALA 051 TaxID=869949 RepID=UPI000D0DD9BA|nr:threonine dehydratase [Chroococcidiopsis sp. CCALA 051]PSM47541.1 threonine dehydratase [Chroococcidiopsis sp. CCALA 051]